MREGWKEVIIGDLGQVITGNTPPRKNPEYYGEHTLFVKPTDVSEGEKYTYYPEECYSELGFKKYIKSLIPKGSTCVVTIGSIGKKMTKAHCDLFINQAMNAVIPNDNFDEEFVYYVLKFNLSQLKTFDSGTASGRENVSKSSFSNIKIKVPINKNVQRKIGEILSGYDDLIENNLKRIKILEEMAQQTYEEWFVRMRFPGHESATINPETGLPEGWEKDLVSNQLGKVKSTTKIKSSEFQNEGNIPVVDQSRSFIAGFTNDDSSLIEYSGIPYIVFGDHTRILKLINFDFARGADGTQIVLSKNPKMPQHLFYFSLMNIDLSNYHYARHYKYLKDSEIIIPTEDIAKRFEELAKKYFDAIQNLRTQNQRLREARDILLPRLMMGMIEV